uniref:IS3 family transposase n=1 Tax=Bacillus sp. DX2.2 TaxID=3073452 RepID=UPI00402AC232
MVRYFCELAGVSRSGYYAWLHKADMYTEKELCDEKDYELIQEIFNQKKKKCGARFIKMTLENIKGIKMNLKRIFRIMRKYNLVTKTRRANPYKQIAKATQEHKACPNLLQRQFNQEEPEKRVLLQSFRRHKEMGNIADQFYETINNLCNALYVEKTKFG